jgi:hypothetical protein
MIRRAVDRHVPENRARAAERTLHAEGGEVSRVRTLLRVLLLSSGLVLAGCAGGASSSPTADPAEPTRGPSSTPTSEPIRVQLDPLPGDTALPSGEDETGTTSTVPASREPAVAESGGPGTVEAFTELRKDAEGRLIRWYRDGITVSFASGASSGDELVLRDLAASLAGVPGVPRLTIVDTPDADVVVHILEKNRWRSIVPGVDIGDEIDGQARYVHVDGRISGSIVLVNASSSQLQRNRTIVHEMLHAYGLGHHSCPGGILYGGSEYDPRWELGAYDRVLLQAWYADHQGEPSLDVDVPCPPVVWDTVTFQGQVLWCRAGSGECHLVDERDGVRQEEEPFGWYTRGSITTYDPTKYVSFTSEGGVVLCSLVDEAYQPCELGASRTVTAPDRWYDGEFLYDHNPGTHLVRIFEGRRLLCEVPRGGRAPCQYTDGPALTAIDLYTDGEFIYNTP